jgi:predicted metalloprotease with PDZ domain
MSYQAPFVDAAKSVDPVNRNNTFISYYSYGSMLGLALDLSLREKGLHLDDYMKLMWANFGKHEQSYTVEDLHNTLNSYAGTEFGDFFFNHYIYKSEMPNMEQLLNRVGVSLTQDSSKVWFGATVVEGLIMENTIMGSPAYLSGLDHGDRIIKIGDVLVDSTTDFNAILNAFKPNNQVSIVYERHSKTKQTTVTLQASKSYDLSLFEANNKELSNAERQNRADWLQAK